MDRSQYTRAFIGGLLVLCTVFVAFPVSAQELVQDKQTIVRAQVLEIISQDTREVIGTDTRHSFQEIRVRIVSGEEVGKELTLENDFLNLRKGEDFYLSHTVSGIDGSDYYQVYEPYRLPQLAILLALFVGVVAFFGGRQGIRGLIALAASFAFIIFLLLPGILHGLPVIPVTVGVASLIIVVGSYVTHGVNKTTSIAVLGMIATVVITGLLAYWSVYFTHLSGFTDDETVYLNFNTHGAINLAGLLIGGILIGTLGVLYDAAIGQAVTVEELVSAAPHITRGEAYRRAVRIGREHIGALVNTLAIAYVGTSLPLLLLFYGFGADSFAININKEIFANEIVRSIVGSIGLVLAVPITTVIAVRLLVHPK